MKAAIAKFDDGKVAFSRASGSLGPVSEASENDTVYPEGALVKRFEQVDG